MQFIINQDRDIVIEKGPMHTFPVVENGKIYEINLYCGEYLLGTFASIEEAINEMSRIDASEDQYILVDGFSADEDSGAWILSEIDMEDITPDELRDLIMEALSDD
ncbi:hypothetical protein [Oscillibacter sp.]|uniref:hypothetical protein n=1 Tax=Oscillibacter sp. TaxID=1945593 RepID=UPI002897D5CD|nr:hypothetical protein [Oscillibacter sp.]